MKIKYIKSPVSYLKHYCSSVRGNTKNSYTPTDSLGLRMSSGVTASIKALKFSERCQSWPQPTAMGHEGFTVAPWRREAVEDTTTLRGCGGCSICIYDKSLAQAQPSAAAQYLLASVITRGMRQYPKLQGIPPKISPNGQRSILCSSHTRAGPENNVSIWGTHSHHHPVIAFQWVSSLFTRTLTGISRLISINKCPLGWG